MSLKLTRRRFGQLAIAGTAAAGVAYLANKTLAQTPSIVVIGVTPGAPTSIDDATSTVVDFTDLGENENTTAASTNVGLLLPTFNVATAQPQTPLTTPEGVNLLSDEELTGFTSLRDGTLVLAVTPVSTSNKDDAPTRLIFLSTPTRTVTVSGLKKQEKLESLVGTNENGLLGLVVRKNGQPPVTLVEINPQTGAVTSSNKINLPGNERFSNLAQCPDGRLYTTTVGKRGETSLVQLDLGEKKPVTVAQLQFEGNVWNNGLQSLVCSSASQLFAFGARRYETPNSLYLVDATNGSMTKLGEFDATKVTIASA